VRETLFNWLQNDIQGARCLDLFTGSGALGLEALSRGAEYGLLIDEHPKVVSQLRQHLETLQATGGEIRQGDALQILATPPDLPFDIVFLDPPFGNGLIMPCVEVLESNGWLSENSRIYIEAETDCQDLKLPDPWEMLRQQKVGQVSCHLAARHPATPES
jgi:16S rRNA (guanine966-N2)-methyltransferase